MWTLDIDHSLPLWRTGDVPGAVLSFSTRRGGVSAAPFTSLNLGRSTADHAGAVDENRRRMLAAIGLDADRLATAGQVHGTAVTIATEPGLHPETDALITTTPGLALAVTCADCLPILYAAPGVVAAAHSGWRGTADGMPVAALDAVYAQAPADPEALTIHLGPSIRGCCYQVGPEVADRFPPGSVSKRDGALYLDLADATRKQLIDHGVVDSQIHVTPACTACDDRLYFSHRRDAGRTGRHWAVAALPASTSHGT